MKTQLLEIKVSETPLELKVLEDTQYVLFFPDRAADGVRFLTLMFEKEGVSAEILAPFSLSVGEKLKLVTSSVHKVPNTSCITNVKGVLGDGSKSDYVGKIIIEKPAHGTKAFLRNNILVTGDNVVNNSSPILEIDANDVKASHGATTGRVSEEEVFYLMSRGLDRAAAESLIISGFFNSMLEGINDDKIRERAMSDLSGIL